MASSKAQIKASNKYNKEHYSKVQANIDKNDYNGICAYCSASGMSKATLITEATKKYIREEVENGNLDIEQANLIADAYGADVTVALKADGSTTLIFKNKK